MRGCCVPGCKTSGRMPSHQIPKDPKRRSEWLQHLQLAEQEHNIINKLRVCYKHFKDTDYSCAIHCRRLVDRAIPSIEIVEDQVKTTREKQKTIEMPQQEETTEPEQLQEQDKETFNTDMQVVRIVTDHEMVIHYEQSIPALKQNVDMIKQELKAQQLVKQQERKEIRAHEQNIQVLQENVDIMKQEISAQQLVKQQERKEIMAHGQSIQILKENVNMIKQELKAQQGVNQEERTELKTYHDSPYTSRFYPSTTTAARRPYLGEITRKEHLSPTARKFYDDNVKLRKDVRRLKRRIANLKKDLKSKAILLNTINKKSGRNCCCTTKVCKSDKKK